MLIDLAGMDYETQVKLINAYRGTFPMYSDSMFGLPTAVLAAVYAALPPGAKLASQRFVLVGGAFEGGAFEGALGRFGFGSA